jgi:hypothetical protein
MPDPLHLRPDIHAVALDKDVVFLDESADRYIFLPGGADLVNLREDGGVLAANADAAELLLTAGFVRRGAAPPDRPSLPALPTRPLPPSGGPSSVTLRECARLAGAMLDLWLHYRGRPLAHILDFVRQRRPMACSDATPAEVQRLAALFERAAIWLPAPRKCLVRSFLLMRFLQRSGCDAQWVLGVRLSPFAAHCWVQSHDVVLDEVPERLLRYRPICVV